MRIDNTYLASVIQRDIIPTVAWSAKYYQGKLCYVIKRPTYCIVWWMDFWFNQLAKKFSNQNVISRVPNQDLTLPVIITEDGILLNVPPIIQQIAYYAEEEQVSSPLIFPKITITSVFIFGVLLLISVILLTWLFCWDSPYAMYI